MKLKKYQGKQLFLSTKFPSYASMTANKWFLTQVTRNKSAC